MNRRNKYQTRFAEDNLKAFQRSLINEMWSRKSFSLNLSDEEVSKLTQTSLRTSRRYLGHLVKRGVFETQRKRHFHHAFGWCNDRAILLTTTQRIVEEHRRKTTWA